MQCFKETKHSWYPSFYMEDRSFVEVSLSGWGADDFGLSQQFTSHKEALREFLALIGMDHISPHSLERRGYRQ